MKCDGPTQNNLSARRSLAPQAFEEYEEDEKDEEACGGFWPMTEAQAGICTDPLSNNDDL